MPVLAVGDAICWVPAEGLPYSPGAPLDEIVLTNLKERVLAPDRIADLLKSLMERQATKSEWANHRLLALQKELSDTEDCLKLLIPSEIAHHSDFKSPAIPK
ncbi:hypothetical protein V4R08_16220 (plasmid) [Nitrobacter sp. NHB1]|uniref:hypothetical protein n=1 Tax=Nitrobacter sp. NHB1 TaxID=3119830 RepID=UPI002FFF65EB